MLSRQLKASLAMIALLLTAPLPALAQGQGAEEHHPESGPGSAAPPAQGGGEMQRMPEGTMPESGSMMMDGNAAEMDMMDCPMMAQMMRMHPGMMSQRIRLHPDMMAMMHGQKRPGGEMMGRDPAAVMMMQGGRSGMMMRPGGMGLDAGIVTPIQHLSTDDVRHYFQHRLTQIGNDRLKLGEVAETNDELITVDIVTVDNSLVDRLEVDRHSGAFQRAQ